MALPATWSVPNLCPSGRANPWPEQQGVLRHSQALTLFSRGHIRSQLSARRWQRPARGVIVLHNGPLTDSQRVWAAVLSCPPGAALGGLSALLLDGFDGFHMSAPETTHVILPEGASRPRNPKITPHWSTRLDAADVQPAKAPLRTRTQRSLVDEATWSSPQRRARAVILAGVQQGLATPATLRDALSRRGPCGHRRLIVESIADAEGGIQSLPERDFEIIRRRAGVPVPTRQQPVRRGDGKYYLDVGWDAYQAACEIHGIPHLAILQWDSDLMRANEVTIEGPRLAIFSSYSVRRAGDLVADQLRRLLRRGGWVG